MFKFPVLINKGKEMLPPGLHMEALLHVYLWKASDILIVFRNETVISR